MATLTATNTSVLPVSTNGFSTLGNLVWYQAGTDVDVEPFKAAWKGAGLPDTYFIKVTEYEKVRLGIESWLRSRASEHGLGRQSSSATTGNETRSLVRVINKAASNSVVFCIVTEQADMVAMGLSHLTNIRLFLTKTGTPRILTLTSTSSGIPGSENQSERELLDELLPYIDRYEGKILASNVTRGLRWLFLGLNAVLVRPDGGLYFAPPTAEPKLLALKGVMEQFGGSVTMLPVPDTKTTRVDILRNLVAGLTTEIDAESAAIEALKDAQGTYKDTVRVKTLTGKLEALAALKAKGESLSYLLGTQRDLLFASLDALSQNLSEAIGSKATKASAEPF